MYTFDTLKTGRGLVEEAHGYDLAVHPWTFRREEVFVDKAFRGDSDDELRFFYEDLGVDGLFAEFPDQAALVIEGMLDIEQPTNNAKLVPKMDPAYVRRWVRSKSAAIASSADL